MINDLALILVLAGVVTVIFKRFKQPLVLGYIVAGFLAGPHMPYMPTVTDVESVETWSQIGVIFIMFSLGLEFSFKKILKMGWGPILAAVCIMLCMISVGSTVGLMFGWSGMNRMFLGGMLAMSSTTIIYKAFDDLGLRKKKFANSVMSVLILEDILGILLMVVLSAMAVSREFEGMALAMSLIKLAFMLSLWFIVGMFVIPIFFKRNSKFISSETLLVFSVGLCFLLVMLASKAGYSEAFGAFMMGSILAETVEAERIEKNILSVKDLFGAIFFVSVGMLVNPSILVQYWLPILVLVASIVIGQAVFGTMSYILSGQDLRDGMQSGFSMAQIGEFAFIIATLGIKLGVMDEFLYPVVVAVSIITTFITPYMIKAADPAYNLIEKVLPGSFMSVLMNRNERENSAQLSALRRKHVVALNNSQVSIIVDQLSNLRNITVWKSLVTQIISQTIAYVILTIATIGVSFASLLPVCRNVFTHWPGNFICGFVTLLFISPFLRPIVMRKNHSPEVLYLRSGGSQEKQRTKTINEFLLIILKLSRLSLAVWAVYYVFNFLSPYWWPWHVLASIIVVLLILRSRRVKYVSIRIERTFRHNLTRKERWAEKNDKTAYARRLRGRDLHIVSLTVPERSRWGGKMLKELQFGRNDNIIIVAIVRGEYRINTPDGNSTIYPRDVLEIVGDDASIEDFSNRMESEVEISNGKARDLHLIRMKMNEDDPLVGKSIGESDIRKQSNFIVIGIEMSDGTLSIASADYVFCAGDILWLVG